MSEPVPPCTCLPEKPTEASVAAAAAVAASAAAAAASASRARFWDVATKAGLIILVAACSALITHEVRLGKLENHDSETWLRSDISEIKTLLRSYDERLRLIEIKVK